MDPYKLSAFTTFGQFNNFYPHPQLRGVFVPIPTQIKYHEPYSEDQADQGKGGSIVGRDDLGGGYSYDPSGEQSVNPAGTNARAIGNRNRRRRGEPISLSDIRLQK